MNPRVKNVVPNKDFTLTITFINGEIGIFDVNPYLNIGIFQELKDWSLFSTAKPFMGTVQWLHEQDLCPDTIFLESKKIGREQIVI
ncbi:MAG: DUF2442 domain-containing protein [Desulfosporosinus sp.]